MKKDKETTAVKFMINETDPDNKDIYAFFPDIIEGRNEVGDTLYACYSHVGQHSSASYEYMRESRQATPDEYKDLKTELESLGYNLEVVCDLFETPELIPAEVKEVLDKFEDFDNTYENCRQLETALNEIGYTIDYYLDAQPYNLRKIDVAQD